MFQPLALYIGLRYTRAKRRNHFISFISLTSMLGIALGVMALITVLSVMNGFESELRQRMLGMAPHVVISARDQSFSNWQSLAEQVSTNPEVTGVAPYIEGQAMLSQHGQVYGSLFQGIDPAYEPRISEVADKLKHGSLDALTPKSFNVLIGDGLAASLGVEVGDKITMVVPQASVTPVGVLPRMKRMTVAGIFQVGMHEFDNNLLLLHIEDAARLLRIPAGEVQGLNIKITDMFAAPAFAAQLSETLPWGYFIYDWTYRHANFFKAVKMEKTVMFVILTLIVAVAAFNIISTLVMVVTDKQSDIAILRTLGATPRLVMLIFIVQGAIIGLFGTSLGAIGGIALSLNIESIIPAIEQALGVKFLDSSVYYITELPSELHWQDVYKIIGMSCLISLLATLYPALKAARTEPAEALRYE